MMYCGVNKLKCLSNLNRLNYPSDLVFDIGRLYSFKGKDFYYEDILKSELDSRIKNTIEKDTIYAAKLLKLDITDSRLKLLVKNDSEPREKDGKRDEFVVANLKNVFKIIQQRGTNLNIDDNEFLHLAVKIFEGYKDVRYKTSVEYVQVNLLKEKKIVSKRDTMAECMKLYIKSSTDLKIDPTMVAVNTYIDLLHEDVFDYENDFLSLMIMYCLLVSERFNVFKYVSFFEKYTEMKAEFDSATVAAGFNWEHGYSQTELLTRTLIKLMLDGYQEVDNIVVDKVYDKGLRKIDEVQGIIIHFESDTFTRADIKKAAPYLSDSTINRALDKLKEDNKIESMGTGRSAKWIKKNTTEVIKSRSKQMTIFTLLDDEK